MAPPIKTTIEDIDALSAYLKGQIGWVPIEKVRKTIDSKLVDARKLEALRYLGLLERDGTNLKLTQAGQDSSRADEAARHEVLRGALKAVPLYNDTLEWIHHGKRAEPTKTDVGNYWNDHQQDQLDGAKDAALTDAVVFFFRTAAAAGLGKYIPIGRGRPVNLLRVDLDALEGYVGTAAPAANAVHGGPAIDGADAAASANAVTALQAPFTPPPPPSVNVRTSPAIHTNLEIHIAADATPETVEEIFKNMRKYVLDDGE